MAEMMLRKTTATLVASVYSDFIRQYSSVFQLADAPLEDVRALLKPLGIAGRARLMVDAAEAIVLRYDGEVPADADELRSLPGVGTYTARAVQCFAFGKEVALVDTNVIRILRRALGIHGRRARAHTDPDVWAAADSLLPLRGVREYNLGLLDLGAMTCTANSPACQECPLSTMCVTYSCSDGLLRGRSVPAQILS
jgi:A/G-specific adenine glycosylase